MHVASFHGKSDIVKLLLDRGARVSGTAPGSQVDGNFALHTAAERGHATVVSYLLEYV